MSIYFDVFNPFIFEVIRLIAWLSH